MKSIEEPPGRSQRDGGTRVVTCLHDVSQEWTVREIAEFSDREIATMSRDELIAIVTSVRHLMQRCECGPERLSLWDRAMLARTACLARRTCRNVAAQEVGRTEDWTQIHE